MLGIVSDTHGQHERLRLALRLLHEAGATEFVHCGDIGGERVLDELAVYRAHFVWGNTDFPEASMIRYAAELGLDCPDAPPAVVEHQGVRCKVFHGHERAFDQLLRLHETDPRLFDERIECDFVLCGHTHVPTLRPLGAVQLLNPGALQRASVYTVAVLDPATSAVQHFALPTAPDGALIPFKP